MTREDDVQARDRVTSAGPTAHPGHLPWWMMAVVLAVALGLTLLGAPRPVLAAGPQGPIDPPAGTAPAVLHPVHQGAPCPPHPDSPPPLASFHSGERTTATGSATAQIDPGVGTPLHLGVDTPSLSETGDAYVEWDDAFTQYASRASRTRGQPAAV